jgi:uncharacterized protein YlbG (UPF0298 family)
MTALPLLFLNLIAFAQDNPFMHLYFGAENINEGLNSWTDPALIAQFRNKQFGDKEFDDLYGKFRQLIVSPNQAREKLKQIFTLGKQIHNLLLALPPQKLARYGDLLGMMRDILYMESYRLVELVNQDADKVYLYTVDQGWLDYLEKEYHKKFSPEHKE